MPVPPYQFALLSIEYVEQQDNDEAQAGVARALGDFVELVGGPAQAAACLLPLLERLAGEEEVVVRDAVCQMHLSMFHAHGTEMR